MINSTFTRYYCKYGCACSCNRTVEYESTWRVCFGVEETGVSEQNWGRIGQSMSKSGWDEVRKILGKGMSESYGEKLNKTTDVS